MLKITIADTQDQRKLVLEGKLVEPWVTELKRAWHDAREPHQGRKLIIDLGGVTVISQQAENVLFEMMSQGTQFVCGGVLTKHVLRQLARRCKQNHAESSTQLEECNHDHERSTAIKME